MPAQDWNLVENHFDIITRHSLRRMNLIACDHVHRLGSIQGNVHVSALFSRTQPLVIAWSESYSIWVSTRSVWAGVVRQLESRLDELSGGIAVRWESTVAASYGPGGSKFEQVFPHGRHPLTHGPVESRILELRALALRVRKLGDFDSLAREIDGYSADLESLHSVEQRLKLEVTSAKEEIEPQRKRLAAMLYRNLGALIEIYADDPNQIGVFYDLELLNESGISDEEEESELDSLQDLKAHIAPMVGTMEPPIAVTGRRVTPPGGNFLK